MKKFALITLAVILLLPALAQDRQYNLYGVMFYNLENLFDTINTNGTYAKTNVANMETCNFRDAGC